MDSRSDSDSSTTVSSKSRSRRNRDRDKGSVAAKVSIITFLIHDQLLCSQAVVRHLPPSMTAEEFLTAVSPLPDHNFFYFSKADHGLGHYSFSRAYINFTTFKDLDSFRDKFDGYVFVDVRGNEFPAIVELAPFQKIPQMYWNPKFKEKRDKKCGTIAEDPDYLSFLQSLEEAKNETLPSAETYLEEIEARNKEIKANRGCPKVVTPLMEFVQAKYSSKFKLREDRRADDRKHRSDRIRDEKTRSKDGAKAKKEKAGDKLGSSRKERRKEKRRRDRRDKQSSAATDSKNQAAVPVVRILQKEKPQVKESPRPKPLPSVPSKSAPSSSQSHSSKQSDQKTRPERQHHQQPQTAAASTSASSKSSSVPSKEAGEPHKNVREKQRESANVKERIPNKQRPAIQIYRPGSKRTSDTNKNSSKAEGESVARDTEAKPKPSVQRQEPRRPDCRANDGEGKSEQKRTSSKPQSAAPKSDTGSTFRTKVFKSTRKPGTDHT